MAITYNAGINVIIVTGYTEAVPCTFLDIYNADKAGTLSLHARTGITGTDGAAVAVDRAERPADYIVLGGSSNDLYITVANWNGTTATIRITGTDRDGTAQTEDIVVNANGTYYTTKWFKTITHTQVTAATVTTFDYDLTQGQWGVSWNEGTNQFYLDCSLYIGNGWTVTYVASENEHIKIEDKLRWTANSNFRMGQIDGNGDTYNGGLLEVAGTDWSADFGNYDMSSGVCSAKFYNSKIITGAGIIFGKSVGSAFIAIDSIIICQGFALYGTGSILKNLIIDNAIYGFGIRATYTSDIENVTIKRSTYGFYFFGSYVGTVQNSLAENNTYDIGVSMANVDGYLINTTCGWVFYWSASSGVKIYRQYEFDLKAIDKDNGAINGATVKVWDKDSNLIVDTTTNASGVIATQTITRGYYNQANGSTLQEASPHLIKITKAGYTMYEADFTLEDKTDWTIALQTSILRNPSMGGGMV